MKSVQILCFFWSVFCRIRTEYWDFQNLCIQSECRKIQTKKNSVFRHISRSDTSQQSNAHSQILSLLCFYTCSFHDTIHIDGDTLLTHLVGNLW